MINAASFNIWSVLILIAAVHGILLAIVLWLKKENQKANLYFSLLLVALSLHLIEYALDISGWSMHFPHIVASSYPLLFLLAPLYLIYARALIDNKLVWRTKDWLHFLPAILTLLLFLPFYLQSAEQKIAFLDTLAAQNTLEVPPAQFVMMFAQITQLLIYLWWTRRLVLSAKKSIVEQHSNGKLLKINWLEKATTVFGLFVFFYAFVTIILVFFKAYRMEMDYVVVLTNALLIFVVAYVVLSQPQLFLENDKIGRRQQLLSLEQSTSLKEQLLNYMEEKRPYLEEDIKISDLAEALGVPTHHLSELINSSFQSNFFDFINTYRIEAAQNLLKDPSKTDWKILAIAFETGFNNKATFNRVFKKYTGHTPSAYRAEHLSLKA